MRIKILLTILLAMAQRGHAQDLRPQDLQPWLAKRDSGDPIKIEQARRQFAQLNHTAVAKKNAEDTVFTKLNQAVCDFRLGNRDRAIVALEQLIADYPTNVLMVFVYGELGKIYQRTWQAEKAEACLAKALELARKTPILPPLDIAHMRLSRAINYVTQGDNEAARKEFTSLKNMAIVAKSDHPVARDVLAQCEIQLSTLDFRDIKPYSAINRLKECLTRLANQSPTPESIESQFSCHMVIAQLYRDHTRFDDAEEELVAAEALLAKSQNVLGDIRLERHRVEWANARGELYVDAVRSGMEPLRDDEQLLHDLDAAEHAALSAIRQLEEHSLQKSKEEVTSHVILAAADALRGRIHDIRSQSDKAQAAYQRAQKRYTDAIDAYTALSTNLPVVLEMRRERAWVNGQLGKHQAALKESRELLERVQSKYGQDSLPSGQLHQPLVALEASAGNMTAAVEHARANRRLFNKHLPEHAAGLTPAAQQRFFRRWDDPALHSSLRLAVNNAALADESVEWLLNGKAKSAEVMARITQQSRRGSNAAEFREKVENQAYLLYGPQREELQSALLALETEKRQLSETRAESLPTTWHQFDHLRRQLREDEVFIDVFCLKDQTGPGRNYFAWIVHPSKPTQVVELGAASEIDRLVDGLIDDLEGYAGPYTLESSPSVARREESLRSERLRPLSDLVFKPLWNAIDGQHRWIISPDGSLWNVPWAALLIPDSDQYAIEKLAIRYVISARDVLARNLAMEDDRLGPITVIADPHYDLEPPNAVGHWRAEQAIALKTEGPSIYKRIKEGNTLAVLHSGDTAGKRPILSFKLPPRILYLATHGKFLESAEVRVDDPFLCCYLALAGYNFLPAGDGPKRLPGVLTGAEVLLANLHGTELVALSACQTGRGIAAYGHSAASLRHAFHLAGARAVVSSLWSVADEPTSELMLSFMDRVSRNSDKAEALRDAQVEMIQRLRQGFYEKDQTKTYPAHPFLWAAFSVSGF